MSLWFIVFVTLATEWKSGHWSSVRWEEPFLWPVTGTTWNPQTTPSWHVRGVQLGSLRCMVSAAMIQMSPCHLCQNHEHPWHEPGFPKCCPPNFILQDTSQRVKGGSLHLLISSYCILGTVLNTSHIVTHKSPMILWDKYHYVSILQMQKLRPNEVD